MEIWGIRYLVAVQSLRLVVSDLESSLPLGSSSEVEVKLAGSLLSASKTFVVFLFFEVLEDFFWLGLRPLWPPWTLVEMWESAFSCSVRARSASVEPPYTSITCRTPWMPWRPSRTASCREWLAHQVLHPIERALWLSEMLQIVKLLRSSRGF